LILIIQLLADANNYKLTLTTASNVIPSFDQDAVRGFILTSGSNLTFADCFKSAFTTFNYTAGTIAFFYTGSSTVC
jgi:hypothetical protein